MTEDEWLSLSDPVRLLRGIRDRGSGRRWRLLACACVRRIWPLVRDPRSRHAVEVAERYADGCATREELAAAHADAEAATEELMPGDPPFSAEAWAANACAYAAHESIARQADSCVSYVVRASGSADGASASVGESLCHLVRDLFGNPFRPVRVNPAWLAWNGGTVATLAASIDRSGNFGDLPVLADALEDAGCSNADILSHCRTAGDHARGCWVLDLLLGKFPAGVTIDEPFEDKVVAFVWAFENVFDRDWAYTQLGLGLNPQAGNETTFLNTGLTAEQESEDWGNRGALLQTYRELKRVMAALGIRSEPRPRGEVE